MARRAADRGGSRARDERRARWIAAGLQFTAVVLGSALRAWAEAEASGRRPRRSPRQIPGHRVRQAAFPTEIPAREWKDVLVRTWREFLDDQIPSVAGSIAYSGIVAIFPALAAFVSLYGLFADVNKVTRELAVLSNVVPANALELLSSQMTRIAANKHSNLGFAFVASLAVALWSANAGMKALLRGLNIAYEEKETRGFIRLNLWSLALTLGGALFLTIASAAVVAAPLALHALHLSNRAGGLALLRWPALIVVAAFSLAVLYRYGPNRTRPRWRWVTPGSLAATTLWILGSLAYSWYLSNFASNDVTYGSLGALFGFLTWLWLSAVIVLLGAELNCEVERGRTLAAPPRAQAPESRPREGKRRFWR